MKEGAVVIDERYLYSPELWMHGGPKVTHLLNSEKSSSFPAVSRQEVVEPPRVGQQEGF